MKSFDELLESLPEPEEFSPEEKQRVYAMVIGKVAAKPKKAKVRVWRAASLIAACLILITVLLVPMATQKNTMQDAETEGVVFFDSAEEMEDQGIEVEQKEEPFHQITPTEEEIANRTTEQADEYFVLTDQAELFREAEGMQDDLQLQELPQEAYASEAAEETVEQNGIVEESAQSTAPANDAVMHFAAPEGSFGGGGGTSASDAHRREVITDNAHYRSVKHTIGAYVFYENTDKKTERDLALSDFFPTDDDYKNELSLTGDESFYITQDNHLVIVSASGERDIGVIVDGKIQKAGKEDE